MHSSLPAVKLTTALRVTALLLFTVAFTYVSRAQESACGASSSSCFGRKC